MAVVCQPVEQRRGQFGVTEDGGPFGVGFEASGGSGD
jgi:hypothetical protein